MPPASSLVTRASHESRPRVPSSLIARRILKVNLEIAGNESSMRFATCGERGTLSLEGKRGRERGEGGGGRGEGGETERRRERLISVVPRVEGWLRRSRRRSTSFLDEGERTNVKRRAREEGGVGVHPSSRHGCPPLSPMTTYPKSPLALLRFSSREGWAGGTRAPLPLYLLLLMGFWHASGANVLI